MGFCQVPDPAHLMAQRVKSVVEEPQECDACHSDAHECFRRSTRTLTARAKRYVFGASEAAMTSRSSIPADLEQDHQ
jgi:hypothetical protein